jgi:hypothetical protein
VDRSGWHNLDALLGESSTHANSIAASAPQYSSSGRSQHAGPVYMAGTAVEGASHNGGSSSMPCVMSGARMPPPQQRQQQQQPRYRQ